MQTRGVWALHLPRGNGYTAAVDVGYDAKGSRRRLKRKGRTKEIVKDKLKKAVAELEAGIDTSDNGPEHLKEPLALAVSLWRPTA